MLPAFSPIIILLAALSNFIILAALLAMSRQEIITFFSKVNFGTWKLLMIILVLGFFARFLFPAGHPFFYTDGLWNIEAGQNILLKGQPVICDYKGFLETCSLYKKPVGPPLMYALFFLLLGASASTVFLVNLIFGVFSVLLVFLIAFLLFEEGRSALLSALFFSLSPLHCLVSNYLDNDAVAVFFVLLAFLFFLLLLKNNSVKMQLLAILSLLFALQTKAYALVLLPVFLLMFWKRRGWKFFLILIVFLLGIPVVLQYTAYWNLNTAIARESGKTFFYGPQYLLPNLAGALSSIIQYIPLLLIVPAIFSVIVLFWKKRQAMLYLTIFFIFLVPLLFFMNWQSRHLLLPIIPIYMLAGYGFHALKEWIAKRTEYKEVLNFLFYLFLFAVIFSSILLLFERASTFNAFNQKTPKIITSSVFFRVSRDFSRECFVVGPEPSLFASSGLKRVSSYDFVADRGLYGDSVLGSGCFLYFAEVRDFSGIEKWFVFRVERVYVDSGRKFVFYRITKRR